MYLNFNLNSKKVVFVWYLEWDGDGGAHNNNKKKKKKKSGGSYTVTATSLES